MKIKYAQNSITALILLVSIYTVAAQRTASRIIENGGTGKYSVFMELHPPLPSHAIFMLQDLGDLGKKTNYLNLLGKYLLCQFNMATHQLFKMSLLPHSTGQVNEA